MIRLISLDSDTRHWLLVLVLTAHKRGGRSCPRPGRSFYHKTPNSDWLSGTWPWSCLGLGRPQSGRSELPANGALLLTIQCLGNNCLSDTWPWPCLGLDRPQPGRSELPATGALLMTIQYLGINYLSDTWPSPCLGLGRPQPGRSELPATGALLITFKYLALITSQLYDHDLVLVLTARNRGGRSCLRPGRSLYR